MWRGETVAILAGGPSLSAEQVARVRAAHEAGRCRAIAINNSVELAPWADALYFCDRKWFDWHRPRVVTFGGLKVTLENYELAEHGVRGLHNMGPVGFFAEPWGVYTGKNSGYQAIHLAAHAQSARVVLLGYDMRLVDGRSHWHDGHVEARGTKYAAVMLPHFGALKAPLEARGVEVINATPGSALEVWPRRALADVLLDPA